MTHYKLETKDPNFPWCPDGDTEYVEVEKSWSHGLLKKIRLVNGLSAILIHPWLANAGDIIFQDAEKKAEKYHADVVIVGELKEMTK